MKNSIFFWIIAFVITIASAIYQRITGPTYPVSGNFILNGKKFPYKLYRSAENTTNHQVRIITDNPNVQGLLEWKRYKTHNDLTTVEMRNENGILTAELPSQPPAGKLQYRIVLKYNTNKIIIPPDEEVVIRFKGQVPKVLLMLHIITIFGAMLLSTRTGLETFSKSPNYVKLTYMTVGLFIAGGLILGPIIQKYAFGEYWTGWPLGHDLTDNKTAIATILWIITAWKVKKSQPKKYILIASIITLIVFLIPHSLLGSELDYSKIK